VTYFLSHRVKFVFSFNNKYRNRIVACQINFEMNQAPRAQNPFKYVLVVAR